MQILLANDDGIHSPGLRAIQKELLTMGNVEIVAPAQEQSGVGHSVTYRSPLQVDESLVDGEHWGWAVHGSPADCVKLGILELSSQRPELIVSGINSGSNYGINVLYSGTVAAAIEGAFFGIPSIAISQSIDTPPDYEKTASRAVSIINRLLKDIPEPGLLWSINFPSSDVEIKGVRFASMCVARHTETVERRIDPRGKPYFWSSLNPLESYAMDQGTDIHAFAQGYVTVTPLKFDLTNYSILEKLKQVTWQCD
ncbi:MAG: 5'/3'-nucleotidase SurE [Planctomycetaceae bacterium]|nr:5'/3'-nucleotidase SurE [Planctomycetaceae bacterium]